MSRVDKLFAELDALVDEYKTLLIKEFGKEEFSRYLHHCRDDEHAGRGFIHKKTKGFEDANALSITEKQIRQICQKMGEPLPQPLLVLDEYVGVYRSLKMQKTKQAWHVDDFEGDHRRLKKRMLEKLMGSAK